MLVLSDGSALPSFMTYDVYTKVLTINNCQYQPAVYTVKSCAHLNDRIATARSECKEIVVDIYALITSLSFSSPTFAYEYDVNGQQTEF